MSKFNLVAAALVLVGQLCAQSGRFGRNQDPPISFVENKGQVSDQFYNPRPDVFFSGAAKGFNFHLTQNGISYQIVRQAAYQAKKDVLGRSVHTPSPVDIYRIDLEWVNTIADPQIIPGNMVAGHSNYYLQSCPEGVEFVRSYSDIFYKGLYPGIDLHYYSGNGTLKYDLIVAPLTDYRQIGFKIKGARAIKVLADGSLLIKTPFGDLIEDAPLAFQNGKNCNASWRVRDGIVSFFVADFDPGQQLIIDPPVRIWGTYYGGSGYEQGLACVTDTSGNVFMTGITQSSGLTIATTGAHQTNHGGGSLSEDAFLVKFSSGGVRLWATFYGGSGNDAGKSCATDQMGNVFLAGSTTSSAAISAGSGHQLLYGGGPNSFASYGDAFLVKFNAAGVRQWATYYGDTNMEEGNACSVDPSGNVYLAGFSDTQWSTVIATTGSHQSNHVWAFDAFLVKFNTNGSRIWATYYGGSGGEYGYGCATDSAGNVFMSGTCTTNSPNVIATPGAHQTTVGKGFLVKFNSAGVRQWGTYYAGNNNDYGYSCATDKLGNVYFTGVTSEPTSTIIATNASHQPSFGGNPWDAFLVKFNGAGVRQWGTYYGGTNLDEGRSCAVDANGNILMTGFTSSSGGSALSLPGSHQPVYGGSQFDGFLVKFSPAGVRLIASYYGGVNNDFVYGCAVDQEGRFYIAGESHLAGPFEISTSGSHQPVNGGSFDAFLVQFEDCLPAPLITNSVADRTLCSGASATLSATGSSGIYWYNSISSTNTIGIGSSFVTPTLATGIHTFFAESYTCPTGMGRAPVTLTVFPAPGMQISSGTICAGNSYTLNPTGIISFTVQGGNTVVAPVTSTVYLVTGTSVQGCTAAATASITVTDLPQISVAPFYTVCSGGIAVLTASGASSYTWNGNFSGNPYLFTSTISGSHTVTGADLNGCRGSTTTVLNVLPLPVILVAQFPSVICIGESATLTAAGAGNYTWTTASTDQQIVVSPLVTTNYSVMGTDQNGCQGTATISQMVDPCAGTGEFSATEEIHIFPNPFSEDVTLSSPEAGILSVFDITGRKVLHTSLPAGSNKLPLDDFENGAYILVFHGQKNLYVHRLIKQ